MKVSVPVRSIEEIDAEIARKDVTSKTLAIIIERLQTIEIFGDDMPAPISEAMQKPACNSDAASPLGVELFAADARLLNTGLTRDNLHVTTGFPHYPDSLLGVPGCSIQQLHF